MRASFATLWKAVQRFLGNPLGAASFFFFLSDLCQYGAGRHQTEEAIALTATMFFSGILRQLVGGAGILKDILFWILLGRSLEVRMHAAELLHIRINAPVENRLKQAFYPLHYPSRFNGLYIVWAGITLLASSLLYGEISAYGRALVACSFIWSGMWFWLGEDRHIKLAFTGFAIAVAASWLEYGLTISPLLPFGNIWLFLLALNASAGSLILLKVSHKDNQC